ncbi:phosphatase 2C-like domain-containing protein [Aspergillus pseudoustus]|uniref:Phosphatase 2C-like domain-containing protein n=1 Tax=Aspergillus pseudoustus TaxID=1810923 RepID=A0ABR4IIV1_9EURO
MFRLDVSGARACRVLRVRAPFFRTGTGRSSTNHWHTLFPRSHSHSGRPPNPNSNQNPKRHTAITAGLLGSTSLLWWLVASGPEKGVPHLNTQIPPAEAKHKSGLSEGQLTALLSKYAYSYRVRNIPGVDRYDGAQVASNSPCEDTFVHGSFPSPLPSGDGNDSQSQWMAWGVFDGHLGRQTADVLQRALLGYVARRISALQPSEISDKAIQRAITQGFTDLDEAIFATAMAAADTDTEKSLASKIQQMMPAFAGSCALLTLFDPRTRTLHVACTGDSRAVLAQQTSADGDNGGPWRTTPLSTDQTGSNPSEIARVIAEHPGEEGSRIVRGGRVLGLMVSRAFGDGQWKWPVKVQKELKERFHGPGPLNPRYEVRTPPYITAEPVVTSTQIEEGRAAFVVLGTDGLWDFMSSGQAVELVGRWIDAQVTGQKPVGKVDLEPGSDIGVGGGPFDFGRLGKNGVPWGFVEGRTTVQDGNAAVHLVRNALGGAHHELIAGRLAFEAPHSRRVRDDTTVQVVFFNMKDLVERRSSK